MSSSAGSTDSSTSDEQAGLEVKESDVLNSNTSRYLILDFMGEGSFGKVARCVNLNTAQDVAIKILKSGKKRISEREISMLEVVSVLDPVKTNVVQFFEKFEHEGHTCLAFEMLDRSLFQLLLDRCCRPLSLNEIRPVAQQLLTALDALKGLGVIHSDLKSDNIMLVHRENQPLRIKLIDFGVSLMTSEVRQGDIVQPLGYRAPEVTLGLPFTEAIDMWGLGCILSLLYLGTHLFGMRCEYQMMMSMVEVLGQPADHLLSAGCYTRGYFRENQHWDCPKWWLKTPMEYEQDTEVVPEMWKGSVSSLDKMVTLYPEPKDSVEVEDRRAFVSLLKCLLHMNPVQRITPEKALNHPFLTMTHLEDEMDTSCYVDESFNKMLVCQTDDLKDLIARPDIKAPEEPKVEDSSVIICYSETGSSAPCSTEGDTHLPEGAAPAEAEGSSAKDQPAASPSNDGVANPPEGAAPADDEPAAPADDEPAAPADDEPAAPADDEPAAPADDEPAAPADDEPAAPADDEPAAPADDEPAAPADDEPAAPADDEPAAPADDEPAAPADDEPAAPADDEPAALPSDDGVTNLPDGAAAVVDTTGSAEDDPAVSQSAATDGSPDGGAPSNTRKSRLKRIKKFFSRAIRTVFRVKK